MDEMFAGYTVTNGVVRAHDLAYLLGSETEPEDGATPRSRVFVHDRGQWLEPVDLEWNVRSCTVCRHPAERMLSISEQGYVLALGGGQVAVEPRIAPGDQTPGPLTEVRAIAGDTVVAVGTLRQAFLREQPGQWLRIDQSCRASGPGAADHAFLSVDGFSPTDIYAAGWEGEVWHYDGQTWTAQEIPTNLAFYRLCCAGDGLVYAVGQRGLILRGSRDRWEILQQESTQEDLWGCEWFQDRLFVATTHALYELDKNDLVPVEYSEQRIPATCYALSAADGIMWSIGTHDVMQLDKNGWSRII